MLFLDWSNVYLGAKNFYGIRVDLKGLVQHVEQGRLLTQTHYLASVDPASSSQQVFLGWLSRNGIIVHTRPLEIRQRQLTCALCKTSYDPECTHCGTVQPLPPHKSKMIDIEVAKTMMALADEYEEAVLVSGDKDFLPVIEWLRQSKGKRVTIYAWKKSFSGALVGQVDRIVYLDDILKDITQL